MDLCVEKPTFDIGVSALLKSLDDDHDPLSSDDHDQALARELSQRQVEMQILEFLDSFSEPDDSPQKVCKPKRTSSVHLDDEVDDHDAKMADLTNSASKMSQLIRPNVVKRRRLDSSDSEPEFLEAVIVKATHAPLETKRNKTRISNGGMKSRANRDSLAAVSSKCSSRLTRKRHNIDYNDDPLSDVDEAESTQQSSATQEDLFTVEQEDEDYVQDEDGRLIETEAQCPDDESDGDDADGSYEQSFINDATMLTQHLSQESMAAIYLRSLHDST